MKRPLPVVKQAAEGLGQQTIMDRALAARHGVAYVHLVVFAIDVDRVREITDALEPAERWPFGWEVYLTARYLADRVDPVTQRALLEDACTSVLEAGDALGAELPFAMWVLVARGTYPDVLRDLFVAWARPPTELLDDLAPLFDDDRAPALARRCLDLAIEPPLAPPTREALEALAALATLA